MSEFGPTLPGEGEFGGNKYRKGKQLLETELIVSQTMTLLDSKLEADADVWLRDELNEKMLDIAEQAKAKEALEARSERFMQAHEIAANGLERLYESKDYAEISDYDDDIKVLFPVQKAVYKFHDLEQNLYLEGRFTKLESENPEA